MIQKLVSGCLLILASVPAWCQIPDASQLKKGPKDEFTLRLAIEELLGNTETDLMQGVLDPGVDYGAILTEKVLDELIKAVADAAVLAPAAEKIMATYYEKKAEKLSKEIAKLREVWKDGQTKIQKIRYQDLKVKTQFRKSMNELHPMLAQSKRKSLAQQDMKDLYGSFVGVAGEVFTGGGPRQQLIREEFDAYTQDEDLGYYALATAGGLLGDPKSLEVKLKLADRESKTAFLSPYERIRLYRNTYRESRMRNNSIQRMQGELSAGINQKIKKRIIQSQARSLGLKRY
ncbi:hypothetical protein GCM10023189_40630 [Nibrella saemangeumensis]|uniref:Uncharacterized protein n=1 Tax=Nibrella saemangeumensis TaxID=1084526 RepID=A0ABP8NCL0_9BACT